MYKALAQHFRNLISENALFSNAKKLIQTNLPKVLHITLQGGNSNSLVYGWLKAIYYLTFSH